MPDTTSTHPEASNRLRRLDFDEPLDVWVSEGSLADLEEALRILARTPLSGAVTAVLCLPDWSAAERAIIRAAELADRLVFVATDQDRQRWGAMTPEDLHALARSRGEVQVLVEPDPERAVIGSMQWLRPNDTFFVAWHCGEGGSALAGLLAKGVRWRGAWEAPEHGESTSWPQGPEIYQENKR